MRNPNVTPPPVITQGTEPAIDYRPVLLIVGLLVVALGVAMLLPGLVELARRVPSGEAFVASALVTIFVGGLMVTANRVEIGGIARRQTFILVALAWVAMPAFAALPFVFADLQLSYTDGYFEAMSGLTTTGSTVLVLLDSMPSAFFCGVPCCSGSAASAPSSWREAVRRDA